MTKITVSDSKSTGLNINQSADKKKALIRKSDLRKYSRYFNYLKFFPLFCLAFFIPFEAGSKSKQTSSNNHCEEQWLELVSQIKGSIAPGVPRKSAVLFAGQDGRIFNCLSIALPQSVIQELQSWEMARSRSIAADPFYENSFPPNYCNSSYGSVQGIKIMTIHLPYDSKELDARACAVRLHKVPSRVNQFLDKE